MKRILLVLSFLILVQSRCQCEELQEYDCNLRKKNQECFWDDSLEDEDEVEGIVNLFKCKKVECEAKLTQKNCEMKEDCYWAGSKTKCIKRPILCISLYFDEDQLERCQDYDCNWNKNEKYCSDPMDCELFENQIDCLNASCYYNGSQCLSKHCFNYDDKNTCEKRGCIYRNSKCYKNGCEHQGIDTCDGNIINKEMCMLEGNTICKGIEMTADCHEYLSEKACNYFDNRCEWYQKVEMKEEKEVVSYSCIDLKKLDCEQIKKEDDCLYFYYEGKQACEWTIDEKNEAVCKRKSKFGMKECHQKTMQAFRWVLDPEADESEDEDEMGMCEVCARVNLDKLWGSQLVVLALVGLLFD